MMLYGRRGICVRVERSLCQSGSHRSKSASHHLPPLLPLPHLNCAAFAAPGTWPARWDRKGVGRLAYAPPPPRVPAHMRAAAAPHHLTAPPPLLPLTAAVHLRWLDPRRCLADCL